MAKPDDLHHLCLNDRRLTFVQLLRPEADTSEPVLETLITALERNRYVSSVRIFAPGVSFENTVSEQLRLRLFKAVGNLPRLEQLKIESFSGIQSFPVIALANAVKSARKLTELELWGLKFKARIDERQNDFDSLEDSLRSHPSLRKFTLYNCQLEEETKNNLPNLDPLLHALSTIPQLEQVYITASAASSSSSAPVEFTCAALRRLCQSTSLKELGLWKFNFPLTTPAPLAFMAPAIAESNTLRVLELGECKLNGASDAALGKMLEVNTSLEELDLHLLEARSSGQNSEERRGCTTACIAKALKRNKTLRRLKLWGLLNREDQENLLDMIRHNYFLETLRLLDADADITVNIDFFIRLNRNGRCHLLMDDDDDDNNKTASLEDWINVFASARNDLRAIFYYLSLNPSLCR